MSYMTLKAVTDLCSTERVCGGIWSYGVTVVRRVDTELAASLTTI